MITQEEVHPPQTDAVETPAPPPVVEEAEAVRVEERERERAVDRVAAFLGRTGRSIREKGLKTTARELKDEGFERLMYTTRRRPAVGLGIAAASGFVAGKVLHRVLGSKPRRECE